MHYTYGGKHVAIAGEHTLLTQDVTCGNCKRTRAFRTALDTVAAIEDTRQAITSLADAGFITNRSYGNHVTGQNYYITAVDRFGIRMTVQGEPHAQTFATLVEFLAWITPLDMSRVIEHVTDAGMTWVDAMDTEWSLAIEVKDVEAIETSVNAITAGRVSFDTAEITEHTIGGRVVFSAKCAHGWETGFHWSAKDAREVALGHGSVSRVLYGAAVIAEDADDAVKPFRTSGKVKNTRRARRARKGA